MTICAVALVDAMPSNRTSIGAALNDTAQEVGTSVGTAVVGTLIAALVTTQLPAGTWSSDLVASFFHGERITYAVLAVVVGLVAGGGALTLTDSRSHRGARGRGRGRSRRRLSLSKPPRAAPENASPVVSQNEQNRRSEALFCQWSVLGLSHEQPAGRPPPPGGRLRPPAVSSGSTRWPRCRSGR